MSILPIDLIKQFVKQTNDSGDPNKDAPIYGTVIIQGDQKYVKIDGSDFLTPVSITSMVVDGDRVVVEIKNHSATIVGNLSSPAARNGDVEALAGLVDENGNEILQIGNQIFEVNSIINTQNSNIATINSEVSTIESKVNIVNSAFDITDGVVTGLKKIYADKIVTDSAVFGALDTKYATIDFSNIGMAAVEELFATSGIIKDLVVDDTHITGELVGVTIKGDLIEGNTIVADKLVVKGTDGLYYKLNTDGMTTEAEQTEYNSLNGSVIAAKSITATKIDVEDLVAFGATIGGFHITENSLYSGVKTSVSNTTNGIYLGNDGQVAFGDGTSYLKYYKDSDGKWNLVLSANSIVFKTGLDLETVATNAQNAADKVNTVVEAYNNGELKGEDAVVLRIDSSRGTVFKNNSVSTVLSVHIQKGEHSITNISDLHTYFGDVAYLQWYWRRLSDDSFGLISSTDSMVSNDGFTLTVSADDVDNNITFRCGLIK